MNHEGQALGRARLNPTPGRETGRYGGNTCCIDLRLDNGTRMISLRQRHEGAG